VFHGKILIGASADAHARTVMGARNIFSPADFAGIIRRIVELWNEKTVSPQYRLLE
jgi:hypothetical protein